MTDFKELIKDKNDYDHIRLAFESVYANEYKSDIALELQAFRDYYISIGGKAKDFDRMEKAFTDEQREFRENLRQLEEDQRRRLGHAEIVGRTQFGAPYTDLACGDWLANGKGISKPSPNGLATKVASRYPVTWVRSMKNVNTGKYKVTLAFRKRGHWQEVTADRAVIADKSKISALAAYDFPVTSDTTGNLVEYLADLEFYNADSIEMIRSTSKLGWQENKTAEFFPYSNENSTDMLLFDGENEFADQYEALTPQGDPDKWLEAVRNVRKSGRIEPLFMMAASFASPLLKIIGVQSFCVNLWGNTEGGKTVTSLLAASIWADPAPGRFMTDFNGTDVSFEVRQNFLNSFPLILDDSATVKNRTFFDMSDFVYKRCKEKGKGRSDKNLGTRDSYTWRQVIIMNGEQPAVSEDMQGGAINRTLDLACGHTAIYSDPRSLCEVIQHNYGHAGADYMAAVLRMDRETLRAMYKAYLERVSKLDGMQKQSNALAAIMLADELAERFVFKDGVFLDLAAAAETLSTKDFVSEDKRCYDYLTDQLSIHRDRFVPVSTTEGTVYKGDIWGCVDGEYLIIIRTAFDELCRQAGYSGKRFLNWARAQDLILCGEKGRPTKVKRLGNATPRCVFLRLPDEDENEGFDGGVPF